MKIIGTLLLLILPLLTQAQKLDHKEYVGVSIGTLGENYIRVDHEIALSYALMQASIQGGPTGFNIQYKLGAGYAPDGSKFRAYCYLPYMNFSFTEKKYNSPFCLEAFYGLKRLQGSLNIDIYPHGVLLVPSLRVRYRILQFKL